ncbi:SGNH/GDSL hydrolase family protein [Nannocystis bainbridge]|uniref:SGNH/GDSL hydrolase family protein n=1 Tax=Nannocystis bainbridge TaxID=2995303 RepID=A0ABT5E4Z1_9BACT|nr:SGNH/GDSL hydrolase family protein [Nannocystis bainbridge]MDC0720925.1 SGNH/GDSL hydrolase family protein [Nannocystis bainbridge]
MKNGTVRPDFTRLAKRGGFVLALAVAGCGADAGPDARWVAGWATSMMEPGTEIVELKSRSFSDETLRQTVTVTASGDRVRLRLSNRFGSRPLELAEVRVAKELEALVTAPGSDRPVQFGGGQGVTIAAAAEVTSDDVDLEVRPGDRLIVSVYVSQPTELATWHPFSSRTHAVASGNQAASERLSDSGPLSSTFWLAGVEVESAETDRVVVTFGDSITDGTSSTVDAPRSYPDRLFARLQEDEQTRSVAVVNHGLGGNRLLRDSLGPSGLSRFEREVLGTPGVSHAIILIGINDIGMPGFVGPSESVTADELIDGLESLADEARAKGVTALVGTIMPFEAAFPPYYSLEGEEIRQTVNTWIRDNDAFDGMIDFEAAVRDPKHPTRILAAFDSGDHLHPNDAGYQAMADAVPLSLFE